MISNDHYGILHRLLLNETIEPSPEGLMRILGFVHVYSASGLHLLALESLLNRFFVKNLRHQKILTVCFWIFLFILWKLQGYRLGFARILLLFFLRALAKLKGWRWRVYYPLFLAFCLDFALRIDSGWQHYYLAILGGMLGISLARRKNSFLQHVFLAVGSWLMTAPLDLWCHHQISWMTPLWSLLTIPVIAYFLYPLSVFSYLFLDRIPEWLMSLWNGGLEALLRMADFGLTFSVVSEKWILLSLVMAILAAFFYQRRILIFSSSLLVIAFQFHPSGAAIGTKLVQLNVGQGDSLLVTKNERVEMIDLGTSREVKPETILQKISYYGVDHVDTVLFSHLDEDHAGGLRMLLPWVPLRYIEVSDHLERAAKVQKWLKDFPEVKWCSSGCFQMGEVDWVEHRKVTSQKATGNDLMATAVIPLSDSTVYLALGDSDFKQEAVFWRKHHENVQKYSHRILKVSHHGSRYSSRPEFLHLVRPELAVISVGRHNHYHHPHFRVVNELNIEKIPVHRTDRDGDYVWSQ